MPDIVLPPMTGGSNVTFNGVSALVVIGANGSGKSRLGAWIEKKAGANAHRVGAQRGLSMPALIQPLPFEQAQLTLLYGVYQKDWNPSQYQQNKELRRWHNLLGEQHGQQGFKVVQE